MTKEEKRQVSIVVAHVAGEVTEGLAAQALRMHRVDFRLLCDHYRISGVFELKEYRKNNKPEVTIAKT